MVLQPLDMQFPDLPILTVTHFTFQAITSTLLLYIQILVTLPCSLLDKLSNAYPHASFWPWVWKPHHFKNDGKTHHWILVWNANFRYLGFSSSFHPWSCWKTTENFTEKPLKSLKILLETPKLSFIKSGLIPSTTLTLRRSKQQISLALIGGPNNNNFLLHRIFGCLAFRIAIGDGSVSVIETTNPYHIGYQNHNSSGGQFFR